MLRHLSFPVINAERASYKGPAIRFKLQGTRKDMLKLYVQKYVQQ